MDHIGMLETNPSRLLRRRVEVKLVEVKFGEKSASPQKDWDTLSVGSQSSMSAKNLAGLNVLANANSLCERHIKVNNVDVRFCGNDKTSYIELAAKTIKPIRSVKTKKIQTKAGGDVTPKTASLGATAKSDPISRLNAKPIRRSSYSKRVRPGLRSSSMNDSVLTASKLDKALVDKCHDVLKKCKSLRTNEELGIQIPSKRVKLDLSEESSDTASHSQQEQIIETTKSNSVECTSLSPKISKVTSEDEQESCEADHVSSQDYLSQDTTMQLQSSLDLLKSPVDCDNCEQMECSTRNTISIQIEKPCKENSTTDNDMSELTSVHQGLDVRCVIESDTCNENISGSVEQCNTASRNENISDSVEQCNTASQSEAKGVNCNVEEIACDEEATTCEDVAVIQAKTSIPSQDKPFQPVDTGQLVEAVINSDSAVNDLNIEGSESGKSEKCDDKNMAQLNDCSNKIALGNERENAVDVSLELVDLTSNASDASCHEILANNIGIDATDTNKAGEVDSGITLTADQDDEIIVLSDSSDDSPRVNIEVNNAAVESSKELDEIGEDRDVPYSFQETLPQVDQLEHPDKLQTEGDESSTTSEPTLSPSIPLEQPILQHHDCDTNSVNVEGKNQKPDTVVQPTKYMEKMFHEKLVDQGSTSTITTEGKVCSESCDQAVDSKIPCAFVDDLDTMEIKQSQDENSLLPTVNTDSSVGAEEISPLNLVALESRDVVSALPSIETGLDASRADEIPSVEHVQLKKIITEVCACDTTTGSTEDEPAGKQAKVTPETHEPGKTVELEEVAEISMNTSTMPIKTDQCLQSKLGRREWGKELTKIRMRMLEKKKKMRQTRLKKALYVRKNSSTLRKNACIKSNSGKSVEKKECNSAMSVLSVAKTEDTNAKTPTEDIVLDVKPFKPIESSNVVIGHELLDDSPSDACEDTTDVTIHISKSLEDKNPSYGIPVEHIEIVEDDDEDEDEPWPFQASPASDTYGEHENSEKMVEVPTLVHSTPKLADTLGLYRIKNTDLVKPQSKGLPVEKCDEIVDAKELNQEIAKEKHDHRDVAKNRDARNIIQSLSSASPVLLAKHALSATVCDFVVMEKGNINCRTGSSPKKNAKPGELCAGEKSAISRKPEADHYQHAKMQSRSNESLVKDSIADSMWKDMFNTEVVPLDFDEPKSAKRKRRNVNKLLPDVYKKSCHILLGKDKGTVGKILPLEDKLAEKAEYQNTPCGNSYPVKTKNVEPATAANLTLCSCKADGRFSPSKDKVYIDLCQAVETIGKTILNCVHRVADKMEFRASSRLPFMALCKNHKRKLGQHASCPVCGLFCTSGKFIDCTSGKGHLHHEACQVKTEKGNFLCPHCGEMSQQVRINVVSKRKAESQKAKPFKKESNEGIARMCIRLVTKPSSTLPDEFSHTSFDNKLFEVSKAKLLDGVEKTKLITVMSGIEHLIPAMQEKLINSASSTTLYNLSSYILKNDLSQLVLGICDMMGSDTGNEGKFILDRPFSEQSGKTLLHQAVQSNSLAIVHCLVMAGAALNSTDSKGVSPLLLAAKGNNLDILKYLIGAGASVEWRDIDGMTPLHMASVEGNKTICEYLLCDVHANIDCVDEGGWTPLVWAIENGHTHVVKLLLSSNADIHKRDSEGNACIHWGAYSGNTEIIKLLINKGADIEAINELGDRPLHIAVRQARTDAVILLLSHGVDTSAINNLHQTPAECCHGACSENMKSFLTVNDMLRSCKLGEIQTKSSKLLHQDIARGKERVPIVVTNDVDDTNFPTDFIYVTESVCTSPVPINTMISSLSRCHCSGDCTRASCSCARSSISCWYEAGGILVSEFDFTNPPQIFECNIACGCWMTCANRVVQQGITAQLELFKTKHQGWGVRARHEILMGTFVCEYVGELITDSEADERADDSYLFDLDYKDGDTYCMDAKRYGNISRFINHRCEPNLTPVSVFIDHQDVRFPRICLFANTDIPPGTELGFDYGEKFWLVKYKHFLCDCGCKTCKYNKHTIAGTLAAHQASVKLSNEAAP